MRNRFRIISTVILLVLTVLALAALFRNGSQWFASVRDHHWQPDVVKLSLSAVLLAVTLALTPGGWVIVCRDLGIQLPRKDLFAAWYASQLGRYVPGKVWLFAGRAGFLKARGTATVPATLSVFYEFLFSAASVGFAASAVLLLFPEMIEGRALRAAVLGAGGALLFLPLLHPVQKLLCRWKGMNPELFPSQATTIRATMFFALLWCLRGSALYLLLQGAGIQGLDPMRSLAAAPVSWLAGYIVFVIPGGLGVREAAAAVLAAPEAVAPAAVALGGQRIVMAAMEVILASVTSRRILASRSEDEPEK